MNKTMMIKSAFSNAVHKLLEPNIGVKNSQRWGLRDKYKLTDKQKIDLFDQINSLHRTSSTELTSYQFNKREKKRIHAARVKRGYNFKKKTSKYEYELMKKEEKNLQHA